MDTFYLGTHQPGWLGWAGVPLFVSDVRLRDYKTLPVAVAPWALDSGGFSELQRHGRWTVTPQEYIGRIHRYQRSIGRLAWAAPQDWMCERIIIEGGRVGPLTFVGTKLSVREHQQRTIDNWFELDALRPPDFPLIIKVVQGDTPEDYVHHVAMYRAAGLDLRDEPLVGVGSVCRRQAMDEAGAVLDAIHKAGVTRLHGFGFKKLGLQRFGHLLTSADSMAWSLDARHKPRMSGCLFHKNCANCPRYALAWRSELLANLNGQAVAA
jgi:hypothetical protein